MIRRRPPRPRWSVTVWQRSWFSPGVSIKVKTRSFRWRWLAVVYSVWEAPPPMVCLGVWCEIQRERPKLEVIPGGRLGRAA